MHNDMNRTIQIVALSLVLTINVFSQSLPPNAILKNYRPFDSPRTNGRPGEVYRIDEQDRRKKYYTYVRIVRLV